MWNYIHGTDVKILALCYEDETLSVFDNVDQILQTTTATVTGVSVSGATLLLFLLVTYVISIIY